MNRSLEINRRLGIVTVTLSHRGTFGVLTLCGVCLLCFGCGAREARLPTFVASGKVVSADGVPVPHAMVVLHPLDGAPDAPRPRGTTDTEGRFQLTTYDTNDGAPEGQFAVTVEQWIRDNPNLPPTNHLPASFSKTESSGIRILIAKGENALELIQIR